MLYVMLCYVLCYSVCVLYLCHSDFISHPVVLNLAFHVVFHDGANKSVIGLVYKYHSISFFLLAASVD